MARFEYVDEPATSASPALASASAAPGRFVFVDEPPKSVLSQAGSALEALGRLRHNIDGGMVGSLAGIGATLLWPIDKTIDAIKGDRKETLSDLIKKQEMGDAYKPPLTRNQERRADIEGALGQVGVETNSLPYQASKITSDIAITYPLGGLLGQGAKLLGTSPPVVSALSSGGMTTGRAVAPGFGPAAADMALRMGAGGVVGAASAGLIDPSSAVTGGLLGAAIPPVAKGVGTAANAVTRAIHEARIPADVKLAGSIAEMAGVNPRSAEEIARLRAVLEQQGPRLLPGVQPTVPQLLQTPEISQLQRSVRAASPAAFAERELANNAARLESLNGIAPVSGTVQQAAEDVGSTIAASTIPVRDAARARVSRLFDAVDPFGEARITLPIDKMREARAQFLGPGTFGSGGSAQTAIDTAEALGTEVLPAVKAMRGTPEAQTVLQAVRKAGGLRVDSAGGMTREIAELGRKQSGTTGLINKQGKTIDQMAEIMHERGFIAEPDPSLLLDAMRGNLSGKAHYGADVMDDAFRARLDRSMGDLPEAGRVSKPVTFQEVQNLRSSLNSAWNAARMSQNAQEAAALRKMIDEIDAQVGKVASGKTTAGEYFPPDMTKTWREALDAHRARKLQFDTGPQAAIYRTGRDGQPMAQGAEIPGRFFNSSRSQVEDAQAFRRLVQYDPGLLADLRRYAITDAASQTDRLGNLTNAKFNRWLDARSGATGQIFTAQQRAILKGVADDLRRADLAESMGRSTGSDTAQKIASMSQLGMLDGQWANLFAGRVPGGRFLLDTMRDPMRSAKTDQIGGLLLDPEKLGGLLGQGVTLQAQKPVGLLGGPVVNPLAYRALPLLGAPAGRAEDGR